MLRSPGAAIPNSCALNAMPHCNAFFVSFGVGFVISLKALLANLLGKERGHKNENASKLVHFASLGIIAGFSISQSIFRFFLDLKAIL